MLIPGFRTGTKSLAIYLRQLGTYLRAGVDVRRALGSLARGAPSRGLRQASLQIASELEAGEALAEALARNARCFRPLIVEMVRAGEETGALDQTLFDLAEYYEWHHSLWRAVIGRLVYPGLMLFLAAHFLAGVMYFFPAVREIFELPHPSTILLGFYGVVGGILAAWLVLPTLFGGMNVLDYVLYYLPIVGKQVRRLARARFSLAMALLVRSATSLPQALEFAARGSGNSVFIRRMPAAIEAVREGETLTGALRGTRLFDRQYLTVLETGETAGSQEEAFRNLGQVASEQARFALQNISLIATWMVYGGYMALLGYLIIKMGVKLWGGGGILSGAAGGY